MFTVCLLFSGSVNCKADVLELTADTMEGAIKKYDNLFVFFYNVDNQLCKEYLAEYNDLADSFAIKGITFAKVDGMKYRKL